MYLLGDDGPPELVGTFTGCGKRDPDLIQPGDLGEADDAI